MNNVSYENVWYTLLPGCIDSISLKEVCIMPKSFHFSLVIKGILIAAAAALILSLIYSLLLSFTALPESNLTLNIIFGLSVFLGAALTAYQAGTRGLYYGLATGIGFSIFLILIFSILVSGSPSWIVFGEKAIISIVSGGIGGILGIVVKR
jgi:putative membrane protein (TIGR04086 family)